MYDKRVYFIIITIITIIYDIKTKIVYASYLKAIEIYQLLCYILRVIFLQKPLQGIKKKKEERILIIYTYFNNGNVETNNTDLVPSCTIYCGYLQP